MCQCEPIRRGLRHSRQALARNSAPPSSAVKAVIPALALPGDHERRHLRIGPAIADYLRCRTMSILLIQAVTSATGLLEIQMSSGTIPSGKCVLLTPHRLPST